LHEFTVFNAAVKTSDIGQGLDLRGQGQGRTSQSQGHGHKMWPRGQGLASRTTSLFSTRLDPVLSRHACISAAYAVMQCLSVRCLSRSCIVSKRLQIRPWLLCNGTLVV